jgi:hypothetical protein
MIGYTQENKAKVLISQPKSIFIWGMDRQQLQWGFKTKFLRELGFGKNSSTHETIISKIASSKLSSYVKFTLKNVKGIF